MLQLTDAQGLDIVAQLNVLSDLIVDQQAAAKRAAEDAAERAAKRATAQALSAARNTLAEAAAASLTGADLEKGRGGRIFSRVDAAVIRREEADVAKLREATKDVRSLQRAALHATYAASPNKSIPVSIEVAAANGGEPGTPPSRRLPRALAPSVATPVKGSESDRAPSKRPIARRR